MCACKKCQSLIDKYLFSKKAATIIALLSLLILVLSAVLFEIFPLCCLEKYGNFVGGLVACLLAFVNAILLYITLNHQDRSFEHERFETTFFNLLESHRKITDGLNFYAQEEYHTEVSSNLYQGRNCFFYAQKEISAIKQALSTKNYLGKADNWAEQCVDNIYEKHKSRPFDPYNDYSLEEELNDFYRDNHIKYINSKYGIEKEIFESLKGQSQTLAFKRKCYEIFSGKSNLFYEHYLRSLQQILLYVVESNKQQNEKEHYTKFVASQKSTNELCFIYHHSLKDKNFNDILINSGMQKILSEIYSLKLK